MIHVRVYSSLGAIKEAQVLVRIEVVYIVNTERWPILVHTCMTFKKIVYGAKKGDIFHVDVASQSKIQFQNA